MQKLIIIGAGGFGRETAWLVEEINREATVGGGAPVWELCGFFDGNKALHGKALNGCRVLGDEEAWRDYPDVTYVIAIADPGIKKCIVEKLPGVQFATLVHPRAEVAPSAELGEGCIIQAGCIVSTNVVLGKHVGLNPQCGIGHDARIGDYSTLYWDVSIAGFVEIGPGALLGSKTCVIQGLSLGEGVKTGAGAVVVKDLPGGVTAAGVPARVISSTSGNP